ncbi:Uncharacterized protein FKW44_019194 [Caligus rogercresseyi]|uniref:TPPC8 second Ig-like domain-containing protein n=1 Tax=Caligus rogercresseyi TaxID=217165 RepID=A0A7T8GVJ7_CALRO|nr:Uncharacterized protein FKW44_019194 [Caligus rogercresseyi]
MLILSFLPGLLSFGGKKSNQLFEYPLTSDPNLFNSKESSPHGIPTPKVLDALPVPLGKGGALDPGKSLKLRIFIKSPQATGNHAIKLIFFYYEKAGGGHPRHRILCHQFNIKVLPCLSLSSQLLSPFLYNNSRDQVLSLFLTNGTTTSNKTQQQISLESVTLSQIGLISRDRSLSSSNAAASNNSNNNCLLVLSNNKWGEDIIVKRGESLKLVINTSNEEDSGEGLHFSELKSKSIQGSYSFHSPPYLDFLKSAFSFPKNEGPSLKNDVLAVVWRSGELSGLMLSEVKHEESSRAMEEEEEEGGGGAQNEDEGSSLISLDSSLTTLKPNFPLRVELKADPLSQADFEASPLFRAPFRISISNLANRNLYLHYQAPPQNILGCTSGSNVLLEAHSSKTFNLKAALTTPGLFHLRGGFMFQVTEGPLSDTTELEYVPMDISFIVKNKTSS